MDTPLASQLRTAREQRSLTLADAAHETRIPVPRLKQLEEGNLAAFGNMAYARSFIRIYSQFLGVDASKFVKELPEPIFGGPQDYRYLTESYGPWIDHRVRSASYGQRDPSSASARGVYALVLFLVLGICSAVLAHNFLFPKPSDGVDVKPAAVQVQAQSPVTLAQPTTTSAEVKPIAVDLSSKSLAVPVPAKKLVTLKAPPPVTSATPAPAKTFPKPTPPPAQSVVATLDDQSQGMLSLAGTPPIEIRAPDVSTMRVKRAEPLGNDSQASASSR